MRRTIEDRLLDKVIIDTNGCWLFIGSLDNDGYGQIWFEGKNRKASIISYEVFKKVKVSLHVLHRCDVRNCINPDHLYEGTQKQNIRDCVKKGRFRSNLVGWNKR